MLKNVFIAAGILMAASAQANTLRCDVYGTDHKIAVTRAIMLEPGTNALYLEMSNPKVEVNVLAFGNLPGQTLIQITERDATNAARKVQGGTITEGNWTRCQVLQY